MTFKPKRYHALQLGLVALLLLVCPLVLPATAPAGEEGPLEQSLRFSAFGTAALVYNPGSTHLQRDWKPDSFHDGLSFLVDSLAGAQLDLNLADRLDATVQMVAKHRAAQSLDESLEWGFVRWKPLEDLTLRAGRLGFDVYLLSDYRNVGYAYLWQRPVAEFYGPILIHNLDGGDASYSFRLGNGRGTAKVFGGVSRHSLQLVRNEPADFLSFNPVLGGRLSYEDDRLRLSLGHARATFAEDLRAMALLAGALRSVPQEVWPETSELADTVSNRNKTISFYSLGAAYDWEDWSFQGEAGYLTSKWPGIGRLISGYLSVERHFGALTPYVVVSAAKTVGAAPTFSPPAATGDAATDEELSALNIAAQGYIKGAAVEQQTLSLGTRWDFHGNAALKVQWDISKVGAYGSGLWWLPDSAPLATSTFVNTLSTSINFAF